MALYPKILLPRKKYPLLKNQEVRNNTFVRETMTDVYQFLSKPGFMADDILPLVIAPQPSLREVFELSIFLYGYFQECHIGIRTNNTALNADWNKSLPEIKSRDVPFTQVKAYPLFLTAAKLDHQEIDFNGETHILSFSHKPTMVNFWHFEIMVRDSTGNRIPRDKKNAHIKHLAKSILEYIVSEAVLNKTSVTMFTRIEFE